MQKQPQPQGIADYILTTRTRKNKVDFFEQINSIINWDSIDELIKKYYDKGHKKTGRPSYSGLLLFKISLLQTWYNLSDYEVEDQINDRISFNKFVGLSFDEKVPDHSVLSRFRSELTKKGAYDLIMNSINEQLEKANIIVRKGKVSVDASIIDTPLKPKGRAIIELTEETAENPIDLQNSPEPQTQPKKTTFVKKHSNSVDQEASWTKKRGVIRFGYKKHSVNDEQGCVLKIVTTSANVHEISNLEEVLSDVSLEKGTEILADKGYYSAKNLQLLESKGLKNGILKKATRTQKLTISDRQRNKEISKFRFVVERTFGSIKRWFGGGYARYRGLNKMHTQNVMEAIAYNLYRSPGIIMSKCN